MANTSPERRAELAEAQPDASAGVVHYRESCPCGARRVDRQIGLEADPDEFVAALVGVFREVRRVLRDDGTVWLNLGDSYAASAAGNDHNGSVRRASMTGVHKGMSGVPAGAKPKDLLGIPWMVAFALRADGWYLRSDIVWSKPNPMPESVTDRPTKAHEYVFLLSKGPRYFYDADAIREPHETALPVVGKDRSRDRHAHDGDLAERNGDGWGSLGYGNGGRNKRSVWTVATQPYAGAHFATFPPKLIEPCILAGAPERACGECGAPWVRVVERGELVGTDRGGNYKGREGEADAAWQNRMPYADGREFRPGMAYENRTVGFEPSCSHGDGSARGVVLDPFAGAGTTGLVALQHGREFVGIELNAEYAAMARERIETAVRLGFRAPQNGAKVAEGQESLFG